MKTRGKWCEICKGTIHEDQEACAWAWPGITDGYAHEQCADDLENLEPETDHPATRSGGEWGDGPGPMGIDDSGYYGEG